MCRHFVAFDNNPYADHQDGMNYFLALNQAGRGKIWDGEIQMGEILGSLKEKLATGKGPNGFGFVSLALGLLREKPEIWVEALVTSASIM